jgi:hypothetical protein
MDIFDVFPGDELSDLPEDPQAAFMEIARRAERVLRERVSKLSSRDEEEWRLISAERHGFLNLVVAAGKRLGIGPFLEYEVPKTDSFRDIDFDEFKAELDHYVTQMALDNSIRARRDSVELPSATKDKVRAYIHQLKLLVDKLTIPDRDKRRLLRALEEFEKALDGKRLPLIKLTSIVLYVALLPGGLGESYNVMHELVDKVVHVIADAKQTEDDQRQLPAPEAPAMLMPPRKKEEGFSGPPPRRRASASAPAFESGGMDDDIPF